MKLRKLFVGAALVAMVLAGCSNGTATEEKKADTKKDENSEVVIYLARHGKTMLNTVDRSQGWIDAPLTPAGVEVAEHLGKGLSDVSFDKVVTSDSGRAIETAELVLQNNGQEDMIKEMTKDKRLREYNFGTYEGLMNEEMLTAVAKEQGKTFEEYNEWMKEVGFYKGILDFADVLSELDKKNVEEGVNWPAEDSQTIITRLTDALDDLVKDAQKEGANNVLVVSHGMSIITLLGELDSNADLPDGGLKNASVSKVTYKDGKYTVDSVNDLSYVEKGQETK
ncbi:MULTISPECIES: histidine phosphatase family protein [unclassified Enterococcus]|uniref:histidine phosphatase family protein n=1 Tax=unclassified Enterococcus TaxID=2608891 RepID=UPI001CE07053|nr:MULTISPECIES: histidine phosphatase family protein [unclassified Enterococcus]MCA5013364.1 histidine phosphatase family protein [Enterococcus sp. S23]MCA5016614.1 histidine phosphatase family protein [Enterococcus sp. S22(2020)]